MSVQKIVVEQMYQVAADHNKVLGPFDEDSPLFSFGLDSLCFTVLVVRLKKMFGVDLFDAGEHSELPMTVGALTRFYDRRKLEVEGR